MHTVKNNLDISNNLPKFSAIKYVKDKINKINNDSIIYNIVSNQINELKRNNTIIKEIDRNINNIYRYPVYEHFDSAAGTGITIGSILVVIIILLSISSYYDLGFGWNEMGMVLSETLSGALSSGFQNGGNKNIASNK
jgi:hypothetical protein